MKKYVLVILCIMAAMTAAFAQQAQATLTHPICNGDGEVTVTFPPNWGSPPFTISYWLPNNPANNQYLTHTVNSYTDVISNFIGGTIYITNTWQQLIFDQYAFQVSASGTPAICPSTTGSIAITHTSGGTAPFTYEWKKYGNNQVLSTSNPAILPSGIYHSIITDANGCKVFLDSVGIEEQSPIRTSITNSFTTCVDGTATVTPTGGIAPYTYTWSNGNTGATATNLHTSVYYNVIVTDAQGCKGIDYTVLYSQYYMQINGTTTNASCTNGSIDNLTITGGILPYTYEWSNGANSSSLSNLTQGSYQVTVTDNAGCTGLQYFYIEQNPTISGQTSVTPATCLAADGGATVFGIGGTAPYTYRWSNAQTGQSIDNVVSGSYAVTITDANSCTGQVYAYIQNSSPIYANVTTTASQCNSPTGSATLSISGGTPPYTTTWGIIPAQTGNSITNKAVGNYHFKIVDAIGCEYQAYANIPPVRNIYMSAFSTPAICVASNGAVSTSVSGGNAPYTYTWSNGATTANISNVPRGNYNVQAKDAGGCIGYTAAYVSNTSPIDLTVVNTPASCIYTNDGSVVAHAIGGTAPYTYSNGINGVNNNVNTGGYYINVSDANGCTANAYTFVNYNADNTACFCTIKGNVYKDANGNCTKESNEVGLQNIMISCSGVGYTYTDGNGNYSFKVRSGSYTITEIVQTRYPLAACQANNTIVNVPTTNTGCAYTANFANSVLPIHDLKVNTWSMSPPRPGFQYGQRVVLANEGTVNESDVYLGYRQSVSLPAAQWLSNSLNQTITNHYKNANTIDLLPSESTTFDTYYDVPPTTPLGATLTFRDTTARDGIVANWLTDYTPWNNVNYYQTTVVGAYDPNFKEVSPYGTGAAHNITRADTVMDYAVHFQNLGTYYAQDVVIVDTLDSDFDIKTLKPIYGSHPYTVKMTPSGIVTFTFKNINLPAKQNQEAASKGMITYSIHVKKNLPNNTRLTNRAGIYFDFNAPIITNTAFNTIKDAVVATEDKAENLVADFKLYPNPTEGNITLELSETQSQLFTKADIVDMYGRIVLSELLTANSSAQSLTLSTATLPAGMYMLRLSANNNTQQTKKFVKL
jgi:Secretion system C-terminal sorting domain/SprB repeat